MDDIINLYDTVMLYCLHHSHFLSHCIVFQPG